MQIREAADVEASDYVLSGALRKLVEAKEIKKTGVARGTRYSLA